MSAKYTNQEISRLALIGFCQPKFYKQAVWKKAKALMELACNMNIGVVYRPHRGAGHYWTINEPEEVKIESVIWALVQKYGDPLNPFIVKQYEETFRVYDIETGRFVDRFYDSIEDANQVAQNHNSFRRDHGVAA